MSPDDVQVLQSKLDRIARIVSLVLVDKVFTSYRLRARSAETIVSLEIL
jgi:hypothetical protein